MNFVSTLRPHSMASYIYIWIFFCSRKTLKFEIFLDLSILTCTQPIVLQTGKIILGSGLLRVITPFLCWELELNIRVDCFFFLSPPLLSTLPSFLVSSSLLFLPSFFTFSSSFFPFLPPSFSPCLPPSLPLSNFMYPVISISAFCMLGSILPVFLLLN